MEANPYLQNLSKVWLRRLLVAALAFVGSVGGYEAYLLHDSNFHSIVPGQAYRSGQMGAELLTQTIKRYGIKSVINLRGSNPARDWYDAEIEACKKLHVTHFDRRFSSRVEFTDAEMTELVALLQKAPKPVLLHCKAGSDRTGLAAALYRLEVEGRSPKEADGELTVWYGHIPLLPIKERAMDRSFWHYANHRYALPQ